MATRRQIITHVRQANGTGRVKMASIMAPKDIVDEFNCWKEAYSEIMGRPMTNESTLRWWMDNIGQRDRVNGKPVINWDAGVAKLAKRKFRDRRAAKKTTEVESTE